MVCAESWVAFTLNVVGVLPLGTVSPNQSPVIAWFATVPCAPVMVRTSPVAGLELDRPTVHTNEPWPHAEATGFPSATESISGPGGLTTNTGVEVAYSF